jgi:hypothetical protein
MQSVCGRSYGENETHMGDKVCSDLHCEYGSHVFRDVYRHWLFLTASGFNLL